MMKKVEEREKKKMDQMKKKLHTDDESECDLPVFRLTVMLPD